MTARKAKGPCRHCKKRPSSRPRGLCAVCYANPTLRRSYSMLHKYPQADEFERTDTMTNAELDALIAEQLPTMPGPRYHEPKSHWTVPMFHSRSRRMSTIRES